MGIPKLAIQKHVTLKTLEFQHVKGRKLDLSFFLIMKRKHKTRAPNPWAREHTKGQSGKMFIPCHHTEPCSKETCTCVQNGYFCTNQCIWGPLSRNFFPGCNCKSKCFTSSCPCFAGGRECDPDRCRSCQTCTDPPGNLQNRQQFCRNDNIRMRRHKHLLLAKSTIADAGWGLFCKTALRKGAYIHEVSHR
jgi:histone-lysine N-methyltransferase EZH2